MVALICFDFVMLLLYYIYMCIIYTPNLGSEFAISG